jgi:pimeloyl-ACP methyl ester carboxylesterase
VSRPLVLVHGLGYGSWGWGPAAAALERDFRVVLHDNPYVTSIAEMAAALARTLDDAGVARAHVLGTSLGGMVAQEFALAFPERVDRLVLVCTTPGGERAVPMPARTVRLMQEAAGLPQEVALRRFVENALANGARADEIYRLRLENPPDPEGWLAHASAGAAFDAYDRLGGLRAPTLVLHGTSDTVVDVRNAELLASQIPGARVQLFEGGGHLFFWEQPDRFATAVRDFLC